VTVIDVAAQSAAGVADATTGEFCPPVYGDGGAMSGVGGHGWSQKLAAHLPTYESRLFQFQVSNAPVTQLSQPATPLEDF